LKVGFILKATGVVRRIDDLGRIVIPKEIRRNLRIREGDPLEVFVDNKGGVILKKYSQISDLLEIAEIYASSIKKHLKCDAIITDRDQVIACEGEIKNDYLNKDISKFLQDTLQNRKSIVEKNLKQVKIVEEVQVKKSHCITPIIANGDVIGSVIILKDTNITDNDVNVCSMTTSFFSKYLES